MLRFTDGPPDEMSIVIACGIATYLIAFPIIILCGIVIGGLIRGANAADPAAGAAAGGWGPVGPVHQRPAGGPVGAMSEPGVGAAA